MKKLAFVMIAMLVFILAGIYSCQKEEIGDPVLKSAVVDDTGGIQVTYPDKVYAGKEFTLELTACDTAVVMMAPGTDCDTVSPENWIWVAYYNCDDGPLTITQTIDVVGEYVYKINVEDDELFCSECDEFEECLLITVCREETAFGGENYGLSKEDKGAWFYYFDPDPITIEDELTGYTIENIYGDNGAVIVGTVELNLEGTELTITLADCWELREFTDNGMEELLETVKVKEYSSIPAQRPKGKDYDWKGESLTVPVTFDGGETEGWIIHLCVQNCCPPEN